MLQFNLNRIPTRYRRVNKNELRNKINLFYPIRIYKTKNEKDTLQNMYTLECILYKILLINIV